MNSLVVKPIDFDRMYVNQGLGVGDFKYIFLAEGDSWMERSAVLQGSLPDFLSYYMDSHHEPVLIINLAMFGDELRRIGTVQREAFKYWLKQFKYDAVLFSAGGNDYIDAAKDPAPGKGILNSYVDGSVPVDAKSCINWTAVSELRARYLTKCFGAIYDMVQQSQNTDIPILVNSYEVPVARNAPAVKEAWLYNAYVKNNIPSRLWRGVTKEIFGSISEELLSWTDKRPSVSLVPTRDVLTPAAAGSTGNSGDWINEIHPNRNGWKKLAPIWKTAFDKARGLPV
ncbi:hypothetical protein CDL60_18000 [Roseateles noduli]|nr:hypothetical protein CDL60_18000 [Roseateles noduli]